MPVQKQVTFSTVECRLGRLIQVDKPGVDFVAEGKVLFDNDLGQIAKLTFYDMDDKGGSAVYPCAGHSAGTFDIAAGGQRTCELTGEGKYAYSIEATNHCELDPIIIIDPLAASSLFSLPLVGLLAAVVGIVGYFVGVKVAKPAPNKQPPSDTPSS